jgi:hypothetical protein
MRCMAMCDSGRSNSRRSRAAPKVGNFFSQRYDLLFEVCSGFKRMAVRSAAVFL